MEKVYLDIMVNGKFYKQLTYYYSKLFIIDADEVKAFVLQKLQNISGKAHDFSCGMKAPQCFF